MKIIHCADIHLSSSLESDYTKEKSKLRRQEVMETFQVMISDAARLQVDAVIIAGDLFDEKSPKKTEMKKVLQEIKAHQEIRFYYLPGNHEAEGFLSFVGNDKPENLYVFEHRWTSFSLGERVVITGLIIDEENTLSMYSSLLLERDKVNIVTLHGQKENSASKDVSDVVDMVALRNKNIDYLALGHVHKHQSGSIDARGTWAYPGCLEGRGFDECGEHGYLLLDIDEAEGKIATSFCPIAKRTIHEVEVDISACKDNLELENSVEAALKLIPSKDIVRVRLCGKLPVESDLNLNVIVPIFQDRFFLFKVKDRTEILVDYSSFDEKSLKGFFAKMVETASERDDTDFTAEDYKRVLQLGLAALSGKISREDGMICD